MRKLRKWLQYVPTGPVSRGFIAESAVTVILLLFGWTTVLQAYVIPSGSMENSLLVGDHVFVDKLVYAPSDGVTKHLLPYRDVRRGDIIVFKHPLTPDVNLVKRAIGVPGDHIRLVNKQLILNGKPVAEPYAVHIPGSVDPYRDNFPSDPSEFGVRPRALEMLRANVDHGELVVPPDSIFAMGDNRENSDDSRYWGARSPGKHRGHAVSHLLVVRCAERRAHQSEHRNRSHDRSRGALLHQDPVEARLSAHSPVSAGLVSALQSTMNQRCLGPL
jgi:signal peptidase I